MSESDTRAVGRPVPPLRIWLLLLLGMFGPVATVAMATVCSSGGTSALPAPTVEWLRGYRASFQTPTRLAVDTLGRIYIADAVGGKVAVRAADGRLLTVGEGLGQPVSVAVTAAGDRIYVGDGVDGRVTAYTSDWQALFDLGQGAGEFGLPGDAAVDPATGDVWVVDSIANRVEVYDVAGVKRFGFGARGTGDGQFQFPAGIHIDTVADEVLVTDQLNGRIQIFDRAGAFVACLGEKGSGSGRFNMPQGIWADALGRIFVSDAFEGWVHVIDRLGATVVTIGDVNDVGVGPGQLATPTDVLIDPSGRLVTTANTTARIEMYGLDSYVDPETVVQLEVEVEPQVFDPLVHAEVSATLELPGYDLALIDLGSLTANSVAPIAGSAVLGDADGDQTPDVHVAFDGTQLASTLPAAGSGVIRIAGLMGAFALEGFDAVIVAPSPDGDNDGVPDAVDVCPGFDDTLDADADGLPDACDICAGANDAVDTDGDGVPDGCDICAGWNDTAETDGDGVPDGCDLCPGFDDAFDADGDGAPDACDRCPGFNDALDADRDGVPDTCDICLGFDDTLDIDGDGIPDGCDVCSGNDADGDGVPDPCDMCPGFNDTFDADGDGVPDDCDPCTGNNATLDSDADGVCFSHDCNDGDGLVSVAVLQISNETVATAREFAACELVSVGPGVVVEGTGNLTLRAGVSVRLDGGLSFHQGAKLSVIIDPTLMP